MVDVSPSCVNRRQQNAGMPIIAQEEKPALSNPDSGRRPQDSKTLNLRDNFISACPRIYSSFGSVDKTTQSD